MKNLYHKFRLGLRQRILNLGKVQRIHIVGAARSGTTLLQAALIAFENTVIHDLESSTNRVPSMRRSIQLASAGIVSQNCSFVTKRNYGWFMPENLDALIESSIRGKIGIVQLVRDPRDSLTSIFAGAESGQFYLEPDRWHESIRAGDRLVEAVDGHCPTLTLRYEDLVCRPESTRHQIESTFALRLRAGIEAWDRLSETLPQATLAPGLERGLHNVRDFDAESVGKWKRDPERAEYWLSLKAGEYGGHLERFMQRYGYLENTLSDTTEKQVRLGSD